MTNRKEIAEKFQPGTRVFDEIDRVAGTVITSKIKQSPSSHMPYRTYLIKTEPVDGVTSHDRREYDLHEIVDGQFRLAQAEKFVTSTPYQTNVGLGYIEETLNLLAGNTAGLELEPDFQRGHVWTTGQREKFVEYRLRGGRYGREIWFNHVGWGQRIAGPPQHTIQIVDGLQRLTSIRMFMGDEIKAFGQKWSQWHPDDQRMIKMGTDTGLIFHVNNLPTRAHVLRWYLDLNDGGTPHSPEEIARVKALLEEEHAKNAESQTKENS